MEVRVRSVQDGETLRLDLPLDCSLQSLKDTIADKIVSSPPLIHLSLNKKDELQGPPQELLQTLGIEGGDLIYYTLSTYGFQIADTRKRSREEEPNPKSFIELYDYAAVKRTSNGEGSNSGPSREICVNDTQVDDDHQLGVESIEVDGEKLPLLEQSRSVPLFLERVLLAQRERVLLAQRENAESGHQFLVIAVHGVMLEQGFVRVDLKASEEPGFVGFDLKASEEPGFVGFDLKASEEPGFVAFDLKASEEPGFVGFDLKASEEPGLDRFRLPEGWSTKAMMKLYYTIPKLVYDKRVEGVCVRFQMLGSFLVVYGSLVNVKDSDLYRLSLNAEMFSSEINVKASASHDRCLFELWRIVKDRLSIPVLTSLCEKTGLKPPQSLILLPPELKRKILEFLPAVDVAKLGCVCTEFRFLSVEELLMNNRPAGGRPDGRRQKEKVD